MSRIRTIKPEFFTSQDIENLPRFTARVTFAGIWTYADDEGRLRYDDPRLLKGAVWPLADWHTYQDVAQDVACLVEAGLLIHYVVTEDTETLPGVLTERSFLAVANWHKHQKINRKTESRLPAPSCGRIVPLTCTEYNVVSRCERTPGITLASDDGRAIPPLAREDADTVPPYGQTHDADDDREAPKDAVSTYGPTHGVLTEPSVSVAYNLGGIERTPPPTSADADHISPYGPTHGALTEPSPQEVELGTRNEELGTRSSKPPAPPDGSAPGEAAAELPLDLPPPEPPEPKPITAQTVASMWTDGCRSIGVPDDVRAIKRVGKQAKELLEHGADPTRLLAAAWSAAEHGYEDLGREMRIMSGRPRHPTINGVRPSHTDARVAAGLTLVEELAAEDAARKAALTPKEIEN